MHPPPPSLPPFLCPLEKVDEPLPLWGLLAQRRLLVVKDDPPPLLQRVAYVVPCVGVGTDVGDKGRQLVLRGTVEEGSSGRLVWVEGGGSPGGGGGGGEAQGGGGGGEE